MRSRRGLLPAVFSGSLLGAVAGAEPVRVLSVDVTPFVSPGPSRFGPQNTMGMALAQVDPGVFSITEVTPAAFRALTAPELAAFDLIAVNNHPERLGGGLGTTWHAVVGVLGGGRVLLCSHDAVRFHLNAPPGALAFAHPGPGEEPFGADDLLRQAAQWAGGAPGRTGFLAFNDAPFYGFAGGVGWDNLQLSLPLEWGVVDLDPFEGNPLNGDGYADILPSFAGHPVYAGISDLRFDVASITSFGGNVTAASFHTVFASYEAGLFAASEVLVNAGDPNPGDLPVPAFHPPTPGLDGRAIALLREAGEPPTTACHNGLDDDSDGAVDHPDDSGCLSPVDLSEGPDCCDGFDNDGDGAVDLADDRCDTGADLSERADCMDGLDNDGDGQVDFAADSGCLHRFDLTELPDCSDGLDNDGDEVVDWPEDVGCRDAESTLENPRCNDGLDNDDDGLVDFDGAAWFDVTPRTQPDPGCGGRPWQHLEQRIRLRCGLGAELGALLVALRAARRGRRGVGGRAPRQA